MNRTRFKFRRRTSGGGFSGAPVAANAGAGNVGLSAAEGTAEFLEFLVDGGVRFVREGFGDFVAEVAAEAVAETVDGLAGGGVGEA